MTRNQSKGREVIFEITYVGHIARVAAIDVASGLEAVIQGPRSAGNATLKKNAMQKLLYLLDKDNRLE